MTERKETLRERLEALAKRHGLVINPFQEAKIAWMEKHGHCACTEERRCPCGNIAGDVKRWGTCLCRVLVTPEYLEKQKKYQWRKNHKLAPKKAP